MVLASASRVRSRLLSGAGVDHVCDPADVDEAAIKERLRGEGADAETAALTLAEAKAAETAKRHPGAVVVGADQILECGGRWFDKPPDMAAAQATLEALRGRDHRLVSAVAAHRGGARDWDHVATATLSMRAFSDEFLGRYLKDGGADILASVGAYRLEGTGAHLFDAVDGDYFTVLGLPLLALLDYLRGVGAVGR